MATATIRSRKRGPNSTGFVFHDVTWDDYEKMLEIVGDRPIRVTFDQETMSSSCRNSSATAMIVSSIIWS
jgi:hypothetical protein